MDTAFCPSSLSFKCVVRFRPALYTAMWTVEQSLSNPTLFYFASISELQVTEVKWTWFCKKYCAFNDFSDEATYFLAIILISRNLYAKIRVPSIDSRPHTNKTQKHVFCSVTLTLTRWPWYTTWPEYFEDVLAYQKWTFYVKASNSSSITNSHTDRCDRTHDHAALASGKNLPSILDSKSTFDSVLPAIGCPRLYTPGTLANGLFDERTGAWLPTILRTDDDAAMSFLHASATAYIAAWPVAPGAQHTVHRPCSTSTFHR